MSGASGSRAAPSGRWRRLWLDLLLFTAVGLLMAALGPYRTMEAPTPLRTAYWLLAVVGAGMFGVLVDSRLGPRIRLFWLRVAAVSAGMTVPVTLFIYALNALMLGLPRRTEMLPELAGQVFILALLVMALRSLAWRRVVETRTVVAPPLPEAEQTFRMRLSARRRAAKLIALQAEDHYVRVHTDNGSELLLMRLSDAVDELAQAYGYRLHRSWWAAADAIEAVRWNRGSGEARLAGGLTAPVSRRYASSLKAAGWR